MLQITADLGVKFYRYFEFTVTSTVFCGQHTATGLLPRCAYGLQKESFKSINDFDTADQRACFKVSTRWLGNINVASTRGQNRSFHFHRFYHGDNLPGADRLAVFDDPGMQVARYRCQYRLRINRFAWARVFAGRACCVQAHAAQQCCGQTQFVALAVNFDEGAQYLRVPRLGVAWGDGDLFGEVGLDPAGVHAESVSAGEVGMVHHGPVKRQH
ncbi:Transposase [Pseudomonas syringae pv. actinidiae]|uniref:Transposase n=1 Tax=Pseudomonas syringae pv. actinidiae TaxID=103796 RepID=A0AAN4QDX0_PSESF|nr:Transposase [Pseudomonas syringae pv. actinidiae]